MIETLSQFAPFIVLGVPVAAVTVRWIVMPLTRIIERLSVLEERQMLGGAEPQRVAALEAEVLELNRKVAQLTEAEDFRRQLEPGELLGIAKGRPGAG